MPGQVCCDGVLKYCLGEVFTVSGISIGSIHFCEILVSTLELRHLNQHQVISWMQDLVIDISFEIQKYFNIYMVQINTAQKSLPPITTPNGSHPGSLLSMARPFVIGERHTCRVKSW